MTIKQFQTQSSQMFCISCYIPRKGFSKKCNLDFNFSSLRGIHMNWMLVIVIYKSKTYMNQIYYLHRKPFIHFHNIFVLACLYYIFRDAVRTKGKN